jgi:shikimate dehydrogenase
MAMERGRRGLVIGVLRRSCGRIARRALTRNARRVHQAGMIRWDQQPAVLAGLIGAGIQASRSPALHEREGAEQGLRLIYRLIDLDRLGLGVESLGDLLTAAERMGFQGLNITFPAKQAVIPLLHELSEDARALGAVNTVVLRDGRRIGHNTDCSGFAEGFRRGLPGVKRDRVVQLGAGGAGSAVAQALLAEGVGELVVTDTDPSRAAALAARFPAGRVRVSADLAADVAAADGIVNCTPVGMAKLPGTPLPVALLRPALWVAEIVYFPLETELLRAARAIGCRTLDGGGMAVFQAVGAFRLFTGREPDAARMLAHFAEMAA